MPKSEFQIFIDETEEQDTLNFNDVTCPYFPTPMDEDMMRDLRDKQLIAGIEGDDD